jgi:hypothetical protein
MRHFQTSKLAGLLLFILALSACVKDKNLEPPPPPDVPFMEEFDTLSAAWLRGWRTVNRSEPIGPSQWQQGSGEFEAYTSLNSNQGYAYTDYNSTSADLGVISNWLVSPVLTMKNGDKISFYTRCLLYDSGTGDSTDYTNRLQVRMNITNQNLPNVDGTATGDFNPLLLDINPDYYPFLLSKWKLADANTLKAYPHQWTKYEITLTDIPAPVKGRFAFRYYLQDGGPQGRGSGVAIDHVIYTSSR